MAYWLFVTWLMTLSRAFAADNCYSKYDATYGCDRNYGSFIGTLYDIRSFRECSLVCNGNDLCLSVKYNQSGKVCQLNSERYFSVSTDCSELLKYAQLNTDSCRNFVNEACSETSLCTTAHSQCYNNNCTCEPGYSYRYSNESCVTACEVYGSSFTVYSGYKMMNLNDRVLTNIATAEACEQACVVESTFVCRSLDYWAPNHWCYLSVETAWTKPSEYTQVQNADIDYHHRNCQ